MWERKGKGLGRRLDGAAARACVQQVAKSADAYQRFFSNACTGRGSLARPRVAGHWCGLAPAPASGRARHCHCAGRAVPASTPSVLAVAVLL